MKNTIGDGLRLLTAVMLGASFGTILTGTVEARNRKPLRPNPIAPWELRIGALRVFYEVAPHEGGAVRILAIGKKTGSVLHIGGQAIKL